MSFRNDIIIWTSKVGDRLDYIAKESVREVYNDVRVPVSRGGNMPVISGNLRNSIQISKTGMVSAAYVPIEGEKLPDPTSTVNAVIDNSVLGDKIFLAFTVAYAVYVNRRRAFVQLTSMKWDAIVKNKISAAKRKFQ